MRQLFVVLLVVTCSLAKYNLEILLRRFDNGQGFLLNGTHCSPYWNLGQQCDIQLKLCVILGSGTTCADQPVDLGQVTTNASAIDFQLGSKYGAWTNPTEYPVTDDATIYEGFSIQVTATSASTGEIIDEYTNQFDNGQNPNNFEYFSHPRDIVEPTLFSIAWRATGDLPAPPTPAIPTTTTIPTTQFTGTTVLTTTEMVTTPEPITERDCDDYKGDKRVDGVKQILINDTLVEVYCQFGSINGAYTFIQSRSQTDAELFAYSHVSDYKNVLGTPGLDKNFWLGLDNMHTLTSGNKTYSLLIETCCGGVSKVKQLYTNFAISNETANYTLQATSTDGKGLAAVNGVGTGVADIGAAFTTVNDWNSVHNPEELPVEACDVLSLGGTIDIEYAVGGWWFGSCANNLNGAFVTDAEDYDSATCTLKPQSGEKTYPKGTGVEMYNQKNVGNPAFSGISYDKVRMAIYTGQIPTVTSDFCGAS